MVGLNIAAKYIALAMNGKNDLNQAQRDGYQRLGGNILKSNIDQGGMDPQVALDALFGMVRTLINHWDRENGFEPRYTNDL